MKSSLKWGAAAFFSGWRLKPRPVKLLPLPVASKCPPQYHQKFAQHTVKLHGTDRAGTLLQAASAHQACLHQNQYCHKVCMPEGVYSRPQGKLTSTSINRSIIAARAKVACVLLAPRAAAVVRVICADGAWAPVLQGKLPPGDVSDVPWLCSCTGCRAEQQHACALNSMCR